MKRVLIPTTFQEDTKSALSLAADIYRSTADEIILCSFSDVSNSITEMLFLNEQNHINIGKREQIQAFWNAHKKEFNLGTGLSFHHQFGLSRPTFKMTLGKLDPDMIIVPQSFQRSSEFIHEFALELFNKSKCPTMLLPARSAARGIQRALYLDEPQSLRLLSVQQYPFHVIHKSMIEGNGFESTQNIVERMRIDLIVKAKRSHNTVPQTDSDRVVSELPVLTI